MPRGKDCNASTTHHGLFQKMCTGESWCGLSAWDAAGSDLVALGFSGSALGGWGKMDMKVALLGTKECAKFVVVAASTRKTR